MKTLVLMALLLVSAMVSEVVNAQVGGMKAGLWETKVVHQLVDGRDMTEQITAAQAKMEAAMAKMTPEQRQQMASMLKGMPQQAANGSTRICVSPAMAAKPVARIDPNGHCPAATVTTSGNKSSFSFNCVHEGRTTVGTGQSTMDGNVISTHSEIKSSDATTGSHTMQIDSTMTYLGSDCQGITPVDQLAKGVQ